MLKFIKRTKDEKQIKQENPIQRICTLIDKKVNIGFNIYEAKSPEEYQKKNDELNQIYNEIYNIFESNHLWNEDFPKKELDKVQKNLNNTSLSEDEKSKQYLYEEYWLEVLNIQMKHQTNESINQMNDLSNIYDNHYDKMDDIDRKL